MKDNKPIILIECKKAGIILCETNYHQLVKYFQQVDAKFGVLTNGIEYRFYTDLEQTNLMDKKPFLEFNMLDIKEPLVEEMKKFSKKSFNEESLYNIASELKYTNEIKKLLLEEMENPSPDFVRFLGKKVYSGVMTQKVCDHFQGVIKRALKQFVNDRINDRLKTAMEGEHEKEEELPEEDETIQSKNGIITTEEEFEGYHIIKAIASSEIDPARVIMRDTKSYCGILLDNNNRHPICRLRFNNTENLKLSLFDKGKKEEIIHIEKITDLYNYSDRIRNVLKIYEK